MISFYFQYECFSLTKQIDYYSIVYADLVEKLGDSQAKYHQSKSIFVFLVGSNDILDYANNISKRYEITAQQLVESMATSFEGHIKVISCITYHVSCIGLCFCHINRFVVYAPMQRVYELGARKYSIMGTGPIGCCPQQRGNTISGECSAIANAVSVLYENRVALLLQRMKSELGNMSYSFFNSSSLLMEYIEKPDIFGFSEVKEACCGIGPSKIIGCLPISMLCYNRTSYIFWDPYHPTEATTRLLTKIIFNGSFPYVFPINVKQLSDL